MEQRLRNSFNPSRSGDLIVVFKPYAITGDDPHGATHGDPYEYSAHVPLLIMGEGIRPGTYTSEVSPADLAPTLSVLTGSEFPPTRQGRVLHEILK
jgi:arylsulfatase A-like enzyme